ncbi:MAG: metal ABC transporter ATP-binding protein [Candidatus Nanohaloarchaeota archaeon QJJ-5]|nr:metal ABC transporter ATP-binding protein [Candidatus Nanohaloarchaeota archaeon QJJ-5]
MPVAIDITDLTVAYGDTTVIDDISLEIDEGAFVGIVGPNGSGKTTLIKTILGLNKETSGSIELFGTEKHQFDAWERIGYVPQQYSRDDQFPATVQELLDLTAREDSTFTEDTVIDLLSLSDVLDETFVTLSGGQQQKVLVAMALLKDPDLLILDEPSVGVDVQAQEAFYDVLDTLNEDHAITIVLISHDVGMVSDHTEEVICINRSVCCQGPTDDLPALLEATYGDDFKIFDHVGGHDHA